MSNKIIILLIWYLISIMSLSGQCPDRDLLWKRIIYFKGSSRVPTQKELEELLSSLEKLSDCPYKNDTTHVSLLRVIASIYFQQADYLKAVYYRRKAIDIITANEGKPAIKLNSLPGVYYWLAIAYDSLNNFAEAIKALDSCIGTSIRLKYVDRSTLTAFDRRVQYFFDVGDYQRCIDYAQLWASLGQKYANDSTGFEHLVGESAVYSSVGWQVKALLELRNFQAAEVILKDKLGEYSKAGLKDYVAMIYAHMAGVQEQKAEYAKALSYFNLSLECYQEIGDYFNCKQTTKDIGNVYFKRLKNLDKALAYFKKALTYINSDKSQDLKGASESLDIFANIADIYAEKGYYDSAHCYFQFAFDQLKPGINETDILNSSAEEIKRIKKIHYLSSLIIDKGDAYRKQFESIGETGLLIKAIAIYKVADQFLNKIKVEQTDVQSKLFWRSDSRRLYENAIEACYLQHNLPDAFYFFEKSRAVLLQDQLNEQRWSGQNNILKQTQLEKKILQLEKNMGAADVTSSNRADLQNEIFNNKQELAHLRELIKTNDPLYYQSFVDKTSASVTDVQQTILRDHQALVELLTGDSAVYLLVIGQQSSHLQKIDKKDFDRLSDAYRNFISNPELLNRNFDAFKDLSLQLYRLIFQNIALPAGRIIISPDGKYFPFEALITSINPLNYFLDDHAVSYTYSARFLLNRFARESVSNSQTFMGAAPVHYSNGFPPLLGSDQSLQQVQHYFNDPRNFTGSNASKNNFLKQYYNYKIIQLYTHATDSGYNGEPTIYFSDSALLLSDLFYESSPITSLIVLSACETAGGKLYNGEGVFSFNRQFAALGIPSSISNLWQADDQSTYMITELFYKYLSKGIPLDVALQKAKKEFRKTISSKAQDLPYYWAAPVLIGQSNAILSKKHSQWQWLVPVATVLFFLLFIWKKRFRKK